MLKRKLQHSTETTLNIVIKFEEIIYLIKVSNNKLMKK